jgi:hypothetical protein
MRARAAADEDYRSAIRVAKPKLWNAARMKAFTSESAFLSTVREIGAFEAENQFGQLLAPGRRSPA